MTSRRPSLTLPLALALAGDGVCIGSSAAAAPAPTTLAAFEEAYRLSLPFIENRGQVDGQVAYYLTGQTSAYFTAEGITIAFTKPSIPARIRTLGSSETALAGFLPSQEIPDPPEAKRWTVAIDLMGARGPVWPEGADLNQGIVSYFRGPKDQWKVALATYSAVVYHDIWPGIDLAYSARSRLSYRLRVRPGADPRAIRLRYRGALSLALDDAGQLLVETRLGSLREQRPTAYQEVDGCREEVAAHYTLRTTGCGYVASFELQPHDHGEPLIIDLGGLEYGGYLGGAREDFSRGIAVDSAGSAYLTGQSVSTDFPTIIGPDLTHNAGEDAFVAKVSPDGTGFVYAGFIGGPFIDVGQGIAVDRNGSAYVTGFTDSTEPGFPVTVGPDLTYNGVYDAFVAKVDPAGTGLVYCGYLGGARYEEGRDIAVDDGGNAYLVGTSHSSETSFPVTVGPDVTYNGGGFPGDGFVAKVTPDGTSLAYCGYIGGSGADRVHGIAVDRAGGAYVTGDTDSTEATFPVTVGPRRTISGMHDAFVARVDPAGTALAYCGYIGGAGEDTGQGIAVDSAGNAAVAGYTDSTEASFPVAVGPDLTYNGGVTDAFVAKVDAPGTGFAYCGYIGGADEDYGTGIAVNAVGDAFVTGSTASDETTFPVTVGPDLTYNGAYDAFAARVNAAGTMLDYAGYIGGADAETAYGVALDRADSVYVAGSAYSTEATFPVTIGPDLTHNGGSDVFVARLGEPSCATATEPIANLLAGKARSNPDDIAMQWQPDPAANGYNIWYVARKQDVPLARQTSQPPAVPVDACATPFPVAGVTCTDVSAVSRDTPASYFYQVRSYCDVATEGP